MSDVDTADTVAPSESLPPSVGIYLDIDQDGKPLFHMFARPGYKSTDNSSANFKTLPNRYLVWKSIADVVSLVHECWGEPSQNMLTELNVCLRDPDFSLPRTSLAVDVYNSKAEYDEAFGKVMGTIPITKEYGASEGVVRISVQSGLNLLKPPLCQVTVSDSVASSLTDLKWPAAFPMGDIALEGPPTVQFSQRIRSALTPDDVVADFLRRGDNQGAADHTFDRAVSLCDLLAEMEIFDKVAFAVTEDEQNARGSPYVTFVDGFGEIS